MKQKLLVAFLAFTFITYAQNPNLVTNGNFETYTNTSSTPNNWSSASDFGDFNQNTTDFSEGTSSVEFTPGFSDLMLFTTAAIPLEADKTYTVKYSYKYLGTDFDTDDNIKFQIFLTSSEKLENFVSITNNQWNTVEVQYTPTISDTDAEVSITVIPNTRSSEYKVLFDDVQIVEATALSTLSYNLENNISIYTSQTKQINIKKPADIKILDVVAYSILGQKQKINATSNDLTVFNFDTFSSGVYILKITTDKGGISKKVLLK